MTKSLRISRRQQSIRRRCYVENIRIIEKVYKSRKCLIKPLEGGEEEGLVSDERAAEGKPRRDSLLEGFLAARVQRVARRRFLILIVVSQIVDRLSYATL